VAIISTLYSTFFQETHMTQPTYQKRLATDQSLLKALTDLHVVGSQYDFSRLLGKSPAYFSCIQSKQMPISVVGLVRLAMELRKRALYETNTHKATALVGLCEFLQDEICDRAS
jgi:hypothetical protein